MGGILIRDHCGDLITALAVNLGKCSVIKAELWAIHLTTTRAKSRGFLLVEIDTDWSQLKVNMIQKGVSLYHPCHAIVSEILEVLIAFQNYGIRHIYREANFPAVCWCPFQMGYL